MKENKISRRDFLKSAGVLAAGVGLGGFPSIVRSAPKEILIGTVHPLTGLNAEPGQMCVWALNLAAEHINNGGGIKSMGGAKLKLITMDSESKNEVGAMVAEKLIRRDIVCLIGALQSGVTMAVSKVADRQKMPFVIDASTADQITQQGFEYTFRIFPTITRILDTGVDGVLEVTKTKPLKRVVWMQISEFTGNAVADIFFPIREKKNVNWDIVKKIIYPENVISLATEVSEAKMLKPDALFVVSRQRDSIMLVQECYKQRFNVDGIFGISCPGFADPGFQKEKLADYSFNVTPWHDEVDPYAKKIADEYSARFKKPLNSNSASSYDSILVIADALERAGSTDKDALRKALRETKLAKKTSLGKPIEFDKNGDNKGAMSGLMQLQRGKTTLIYPPFAATAKVTYPVPSWEGRG